MSQYKNPPIFYAIALVQFNQVAQMSKYADEIQEAMRLSGYSNFISSQGLQLSLSAAENGSQIPSVLPVPIWHHGKGDMSSGFVLQQTSLAFHTTHYEDHDVFFASFLKGLEIVHRIVRLDTVARIGVRYLDVIHPKEGESVEDYLNPGVGGLNFNGITNQYAAFEHTYITNVAPPFANGNLVARIFKSTGSLAVPADISMEGLKLKSAFALPKPARHAVMDTDHYVQGMAAMDLTMIKAQLELLHAPLKTVFDQSTTQHAEKMWR